MATQERSMRPPVYRESFAKQPRRAVMNVGHLKKPPHTSTSSPAPAKHRFPLRSFVAAGIAGGLLAAALYNHRRARVAERDWPPLGGFVRVDGCRLHYFEATPQDISAAERKALPTVVLLHGNGATVHDFIASGLVSRLGRRCRVIVFDRPGYGYSTGGPMTANEQARIFGRALASLEVARPLIVGHSWGALVALAMALQRGQMLRGLVLLSGYYVPTIRYEVPLGRLASLPVIGDMLRHTILPGVGLLIAPRLVKAMFAPRPIPRAFRRFPLFLSLRPSQLAASAAESAAMPATAARLQNRYKSLALPTVIVGGAGDRLVGQARQFLKLVRHMPTAEMHLLPGQGHMLHYTATDQVEAAIERALKK